MLTGILCDPYVTDKEGRTINLLSQRYKTSARKAFECQTSLPCIFRNSICITFNERNITLLMKW